MTVPALPLQRFQDLAGVSQSGREIAIVAAGDDLRHIADWAAVDAVTRFEGHVTVRPLSRSRFSYRARLDADVEQSCVVTLEPVRSHIAREFSRVLQLVPGSTPGAEKGGMLALEAAEHDEPEEIDSLRYDLAQPLLEEFSLALDPYPKAPGVALATPAATDRAESPFAVLEQLKHGR